MSTKKLNPIQEYAYTESKQRINPHNIRNRIHLSCTIKYINAANTRQKSVFRIRIRIFWGFRDPDPEVRIRIRNLPSSIKNSKINLYLYCFVTSLRLFMSEE
jgi:hypothetical protein